MSQGPKKKKHIKRAQGIAIAKTKLWVLRLALIMPEMMTFREISPKLSVSPSFKKLKRESKRVILILTFSPSSRSFRVGTAGQLTSAEFCHPIAFF